MQPSSRAFRTLILIAGLVLTSSSVLAQISLVNVTACGTGSFPSLTCTIPATGSGHLIVVGFETTSGGGTGTVLASITDNASNVYVEATNAKGINTSQNTMADIWYAKSSAAGATTLTITPNPSGTSGAAVIWEFSGTNTTAPLDQVGVLNTQASTATPTGAPVSTSAAGEAVIALADVSGMVSGIFSGNSFTNDSTVAGDGWAHLITNTTGSYSAEWSTSPAGTYLATSASFKPAASGGTVGALNACDLNSDGVVNVLDVQLAIDMDLGLLACTANIEGLNVCNSDVVTRVTTAALSGTCSTTVVSHSATLSWTASVSTNVAGYNIYRSSGSTGPYTKLTSSPTALTSYADTTVGAGQTYYYVATTVDNLGNESGYSNQVQAVIPTP